MPFLRAALLKKQIAQVVEAPKVPEPEPEPVVEVQTPEPVVEIQPPEPAIEPIIAEEPKEPEPPEPVVPPVEPVEEIPPVVEEPAPVVEEPEPAIEEPPAVEEVASEVEEPPQIEELQPTVEEVEELTPAPPPVIAEPEEPFTLKYDVTSGERYVDKVSTKTEFDKMLDELAAISKDLLSWQVEKFAKQYTGKFHGDDDNKTEADARKYEAFLGGYITNAAMLLYDNGYRDAAIKQLDQAQNILVARKKLEDETQAIRDRVEEEDAAVDLSDILGMFGDG